MKEKISVIIPIYKVEKYLKKCIDSVLEQTYNNLEIILVDDGSPDNCPQICDEYKEKDDRIIVIHKKNGGLSDARNYGKKIASGKWITFIDSDDYIEEDYIEYLYKLATKNNADISIVLPKMFYEEKGKIKKSEKKEVITEYSPKKAFITMMYQKKFDTSAWGKLYKISLLDDINFPVGKLYEDISTVYKIILKSNKVIYSNQEKYYYLKRKDSIMGESFNKRDMDYIYQTEEMYRHIKNNYNTEMEIAARCRLINANFSILKKILSSKKKSEYTHSIKCNIKKLRTNLILNKQVRIKTKIAIIMSYIII